MSIYITKNGEKKKVNISATDVQLLDIDGRFKNKNLEDAMKEVGSGTEQNMTRIEEKVTSLEKDTIDVLNTLENVIKKDVTNVTIYLDQVNGSDDNDGLSISTPLKSLEKAMANIPFVSDYEYTISLLSDYTLEKTLVFKNRLLSNYVSIRSNNSGVLATLKMINGATLYFDSHFLNLIDLNINGMILFRHIVLANMSNVNITNTGDACISTWGSNVEFRSCTLTSDTKCVYAMQTSNINFRDNNTLNGTGIGIHATRGTVVSQYNNTNALVNNCKTPRSIAIGSQFINYASDDSGWIDLTYVDSTYTDINTTWKSQMRKQGNKVTVVLCLQKTDKTEFVANSNIVIANVPSAYKPSQNVLFTANGEKGSEGVVVVSGSVGVNQQLKVTPSAPCKQINATVSYYI